MVSSMQPQNMLKATANEKRKYTHEVLTHINTKLKELPQVYSVVYMASYHLVFSWITVF